MEQKPTKSSGKDARAARLAAALKANLRKRKAQTRARAQTKDLAKDRSSEGDDAAASPAGEAQKGE
jgi:hypothetical protein